MVPVYATALLIILASLVVGRALLYLLGWRAASPVAGAIGFFALIVASPLIIRLPGRGLTAAVAIGIAVLGALYLLRRVGGLAPPSGTAVATVAIVLAVSSLPFVLPEHTGVL